MNSSLMNLDAAATIELCASLTAYGEAGALSRDLVTQVGSHAVRAHGRNAEVILALGRMLLAADQLAEAEPTLSLATSLAPTDPRGFRLLGEALLALGKETGAGEALDKAIALGANDDETLFLRDCARKSGSHAKVVGAVAPSPESGARRSHPISRIVPVDKRKETPWPAPRERVPTLPSETELRATAPRKTQPSAGQAESATERESQEPAPAQAPRLSPGEEAAADSTRGELATAQGGQLRELKFLDPHDERNRLDRYELICEIASGGMATVFLARLAGVGGFQRFFAIKRLHPHLADDEELVQMFLDEARLAASIHDPHVVPILEVGTSKSGYYLVMDYVEGCTLERLFVRARAVGTPVPQAVALRVVLDVLAGLHAAHELADAEGKRLNLVHRDCTPQNILLGADGSSRITDFGIASAAARLSSTQAKVVKGTLAYLSPEQARAEPIDARCDLFAVGVVLWELLAGRRLFRAETEGKTLARLLLEPIPRLRDVAPSVPAALEAVAARALEREQDARFQTAIEMSEAIEDAVRQAAGSLDNAVASPRDLSRYVVSLFGADLAKNRNGVREWLSSAGEVVPPSSRSELLAERAPGSDLSSPPPSTNLQAAPTNEAIEESALEGASESSGGTVAEAPAALTARAAPLDGRRFLALAVIALAIALFAVAVVGLLYLQYKESHPNWPRQFQPG